jgi:hypothetical protein
LANTDSFTGGSIGFVGGEPTLCEHLADWIRSAKRLGAASVLVQTNGRRLAYARYAHELAQAGADTVDVSLHGPRPEIHDYHTCVPGSWSQTIRGIATATKAGIAVGVTAVVTRSSYRHLAELAMVVGRLRVAALHVALAVPRGNAAALFRRVVARIEAVEPHLSATARVCERYDLGLVVSGMPSCRTVGTAAILLEHHQPALAPAPRSFGPACAACGLRSTCSGLDPEYARAFGFAELEPQRLAVAASECVVPGRAHERWATYFAGIGVVAMPSALSAATNGAGTTTAEVLDQSQPPRERPLPPGTAGDRPAAARR